MIFHWNFFPTPQIQNLNNINVITYLFYLRLHIQKSQVGSLEVHTEMGFRIQYEKGRGRKQNWAEARLMWCNVIKPFKTLANPAGITIMNNAHRGCHMLGHTGETLTFLSYSVTRCGLHQERHASGKVSLYLRSTLKELIASGCPLTTIPSLRSDVSGTSPCRLQPSTIKITENGLELFL